MKDNLDQIKKIKYKVTKNDNKKNITIKMIKYNVPTMTN